MTSEFIALHRQVRKRNGCEISYLRYHYYLSLFHWWLSGCDSDSTLVMAYSKLYNGNLRHISLRHDPVKRLITKGVITFDYVNTKFNLADNFTKVLPSHSINYASIGIRIRSINTNEGTQSNAWLAPGLTIQCG